MKVTCYNLDHNELCSKTYKGPKHNSWFTPSPTPKANTRQIQTRFILPVVKTQRASSAPITYMTQLLNNLSDVEFKRLCKPPPAVLSPWRGPQRPVNLTLVPT